MQNYDNSPDSETRRLNQEDEEIRRKVEFMYSPDGYFGYNERGPTGGAYRINEKGEKEHLSYLAPNTKMAGRRVPNTKACETAQEEFARQDHYEQYGPSPSDAHNWSPQRQSRTNTFRTPTMHQHHHHYEQYQHHQRHEHHQQAPNPYNEYRSPGQSSWPGASVHSNQVNDAKLEYLGGSYGREEITIDDFVQLGFTDPEASYYMIEPIHLPLMENWETVSKYGTTYRGPNAASITNSTAFVPLESRNQTDVIE
jgi:hypothetical protein